MSAAAHGRDATSNGGRQPKRAEVARLKSAIANALTGLTAGKTTGAQLRGLVSQVVNGGGIYKLLNELGGGRCRDAGRGADLLLCRA